MKVLEGRRVPPDYVYGLSTGELFVPAQRSYNTALACRVDDIFFAMEHPTLAALIQRCPEAMGL
jgi:hypothetical protein